MSITQGLQRSLQQNPDSTATVFRDRTTSFGEQGDRVGRIAGALRREGVTTGDRIAVVALNSDRLLEVMLAAAWGGQIFCPLNTRWSAPELAEAINDVGARTLAVDDTFAPTLPLLLELCPGVERALFIGDGPVPGEAFPLEDLIRDTAPVPDVVAAGDAVAGVFYTGGTTGHPKGVMLTHRNLETAALGALATGDFIVPGGRALHVAPLFHLAGIWPWVAEMLTNGANVVLPSFDPQTVLATIRDRQVSDVLLVPTMIRAVVSVLERDPTPVPSLRHLVYAGSPVSEVLVDAAMTALPGVGLVQAYGMTELAPVATMLTAAEHVGRLRRSAGRAVPHALVRIVDAADQPLPTGQVGEVVVSGEHVMSGYWNRPDMTKDALRGGWMHTGDAGCLDAEGYLYVVDRIKDMIITGGENVYSAEVENAIASHPSVAEVAVVAVPDEDWGERVHAVVVLEKGRPGVTLEELRDHVAGRIARFKAPRSLRVVDALPTSAAGKVLKHELRQAGASPFDEVIRPTSTT